MSKLEKKLVKDIKDGIENKLEEYESKKSYSKIDEIKTYEVEDEGVTPGSLILEGGAFRGLYTSGVLDCLMDNHLNIGKVAGISAGGLNGVNYIAGSRGRSAKGILLNRYNPRYVGPEAVIESGSIVGFKVMFEDFNEVLPLNEEKLFNGPKKLFVGCTNVETGEIDYYDTSIGHDEFYNAMRATASMPLLSKIVKVQDKFYLDGGCHSKFPLDFVLDKNWEKPIVVATRPLSYRRKEVPTEYKLEKIFYRKYPRFVETCKKSSSKYNEDCQKIKELEKQGKIFVIEPSEPVTISRLEKDMEKLGALYELGYKDCLNKLDDLKAYLAKEDIKAVEEKKNILTSIKKGFNFVKNTFMKKKR